MNRKKKIQVKNLHTTNVLINDTKPSSKYFRVTKDNGTQINSFEELRLVLGKQLFYIEGTKLLKPKSQIQVEILHHGGGILDGTESSESPWESKFPEMDSVIYSEPMAEYLTAKKERAVSVQVFDGDVIDRDGDGAMDLYCTLTLLGELDPTQPHIDDQGRTIRVPAEWQGVYNVKWQVKCKIDWNADQPPVNEKPIVFRGEPYMLVEEVTSQYGELQVLSSSDAYVTQSHGILNISNAVAVDENGNNVPNPNNWGTTFTFSSGSTGMTSNPILSQSVIETQTQSLQVPIAGETIGYNVLASDLHSFERVTGGNMYSSSLLGTLHTIAQENNSNPPNRRLVLNETDILDDEMSKVGPGSFVRINNEIFQLSNNRWGSSQLPGHNDTNYGGGLNKTILYLNDIDTYNEGNDGGGYFNELGFDTSGQNTHAASSSVYVFHSAPWLSTAKAWDTANGTDAGGKIEPVTSVTNFGLANQTVVGNTGSYFLKHTANSEDNFTRQYTLGGGMTPVLDAYGASGRIIGKNQSNKDIRYKVKGGETITFSVKVHGDGMGYHDQTYGDPVPNIETIPNLVGKRMVTLYIFYNGEAGRYETDKGGYGHSKKIFWVGESWTKLSLKGVVPDGCKYVTIRVDNDGLNFINPTLYQTTGTNLCAIGDTFSFSDWNKFWNSGSGEITFQGGYESDGSSLRIKALYDNIVRFDAQGTGYNITQGGEPSEYQWLKSFSQGISANTGPVAYNGSYGRGHRVTVIAKSSVQGGVWNGQTKHQRSYDTYGGITIPGGGNNQSWGEKQGQYLAQFLDQENLKNITSTAMGNFHGYNGTDGTNGYATNTTIDSETGWWKLNRQGTTQQNQEFLMSDYRPVIRPGNNYRMQVDIKHDGTLTGAKMTFHSAGGSDTGHHVLDAHIENKSNGNGNWKTVWATWYAPAGSTSVRCVDLLGMTGTFSWLAIKNLTFRVVCNNDEPIETTDLVAVTTWDAVRYSGVASVLKDSLKSYGGTNPAEIHGGTDGNASWNVRTPYALIGQKNLGTGNGYEEVTSDGHGPSYLANVSCVYNASLGTLVNTGICGVPGVYRNPDDGGAFELKKYRKYKFSCRIKGSRVGVAANYMYIMAADDPNQKIPEIHNIQTNWQYREVIFTSNNTGDFQVMLGIDTRHDGMTADDWVEWDDLKLEELKPSVILLDEPKIHINYETAVRTKLHDQGGTFSEPYYRQEWDQIWSSRGNAESAGQNLNYKLNYFNPGQVDFFSNRISYAKVDVVNMETWAGDVHKLRLSYRRHGTIGDNWPNTLEEIVENKELWLDYSSSLLQTRIGDFVSYEHITGSFHSPEGGIGGVLDSGSVVGDLNPPWNTWDNSLSPGAGANNMKLSQRNSSLVGDEYHTKGTRYITTGSIPLQANQSYDLRLNVKGWGNVGDNLTYQNNSGSAVDARPRLLVYLSGSRWDLTEIGGNEYEAPAYDLQHITYDNDSGKGYGKLIAEYTLPVEQNEATIWNGHLDTDEPGNRPWTFTVPNIHPDSVNETTYLTFRVIGHGDWYINNTSIVQEKQTNMSPPNYRFYVPMPREIQEERIDFKVDFYNPIEQPQDPAHTITSLNNDFLGGNLVFLGTGNLISGSFYLGNTLYSGIEMAGVSSAYIKSVGYKSYLSASRGTGRAGFMIWSGSVMGSITDEYSGSNVGGVGFEFHGGSGSAGESSPGARDGKTNAMRFRTDTGRLEVTGTVAADAGKIGGWEIVDDLLSGSNITMDAPSSAIYKTDAPNDYFIDFTPGTGTNESGTNRATNYVKFGPNFAVRNDGILIASGAKIEGVLTSSEGFIGGWKIGTDKLQAHDSATDTPRNFMLSGSGVISSSHFYVSEEGDMSASNAWFTGTVTASVIESETGNISDWIMEPGLLRDENDKIRLQPSGSNYVISSSGFQISKIGEMTASAGKIAGWEINNTHLVDSNNKVKLEPNGTYPISSSNFQVNQGGDVTGSNVLFTGGKVGGWSITDDLLSRNGMEIGKVGSYVGLQFGPNNYWYSGSTASDFYFRIGTATNFLQLHDTDFQLATSKLEVDTTNIDISTAHASMSIGSSDLSLDNGSGAFFSGSGEFKLGDADGFIKLTDNSLIISGADANINVTDLNISSSGFQVSSTEKSMSLGSNKQINLDGDGGTGGAPRISMTGGEISSSTFFISTDGTMTSSAALISGSDVTIDTTKFELNTNGLDVSSTNQFIKLGSDVLSLTNGTGSFLSGSGDFKMGDASNYIRYDNSNSRLEIQAESASLSGSQVDIQTDKLQVSASGIQISSTEKSMSLGSNKQLNLDGDGGTGGAPIIKLRGGEISSSGFFVDTIGQMTASSGKIAGFDISSSYLKHGNSFYLDGGADGTMSPEEHRWFISASKFQVTDTGDITGSGVFFSGGTIAGWKIDSNRFYKDNSIYINSNTEQIYMGHSDYASAEIGFSGSGEGKLASGKINWTAAGALNISGSGVAIKVPDFDLDTPTLDILTNTATSNPQILVYSGSGGEQLVRIGQINNNPVSPHYGLKIYDGTGTGSINQELVRLGTNGNKIGGWEITDNQLRTIPTSGFGGSYAENEQGLILHASGTIETADFATGLKGWRISSAGNGTAEFENAKIRGTLATTVFEKESVNVVGGQLMVANSTQIGPLRNAKGLIIAGDVTMSAASTTMSCHNVSGFVNGEVLKTKKVTNTGFSVEYIKVNNAQRYSTKTSISASISSSLAGTSIDPDGLYGELHVQRAYGSTTNVSSSITTLGDDINSTTTDVTVASTSSFALQDVIKVNNERMKITALTDPTSITVIRDYQDTTAASHTNGDTVFKVDTDLEFLQDLVSTAQEYNEGQVIVSTGVYDPTKDVSSGYILMNAKPNDVSTPYMDIIERTGSGPYDVQLRTRLGDLSGLSSGYLYGNNEPGFGLYTNNGFFRGTLTAETGSFKGIVHIATGNNEDMKLGISASGADNHGIHINDHNYVYNDGLFKFGKANQWIKGNNNVEIYSTGFHLNTDGSVTASTGQIAGWNITGATITKNQVYLDSNEQALIVKNSTGAKDIVTVGGGAMSSTVGQSNISVNGGFESDGAAVDLIADGDSSAHWSSRRVIHQSMSIDSSNSAIELFVTNSSPFVGNRHYRVQLKN